MTALAVGLIEISAPMAFLISERASIKKGTEPINPRMIPGRTKVNAYTRIINIIPILFIPSIRIIPIS